MNKTKQEKWQRAYGDTPDSFRQRVAASLPKGQEARHVAFPRLPPLPFSPFFAAYFLL